MSEGGAEGDSGLFGRLPRSRPGTRSPRRAAGAEAGTAATEPPAEPAESAHEALPKPAAEPPPPEPTTRSDAEEPAPTDATAEAGGAGLEDLAWAGIAVTAEAATLGVRLFSRAIETARKATERR